MSLLMYVHESLLFFSAQYTDLLICSTQNSITRMMNFQPPSLVRTVTFNFMENPQNVTMLKILMSSDAQHKHVSLHTTKQYARVYPVTMATGNKSGSLHCSSPTLARQSRVFAGTSTSPLASHHKALVNSHLLHGICGSTAHDGSLFKGLRAIAFFIATVRVWPSSSL